MDISEYVQEFIKRISLKKIEIYNEASIQHELAIFLRNKLSKFNIQLERNISFFGLDKKKFEKKEMDLVIFDNAKREKTAIEIKFPINGEVPEQIFKFAKDIKFLEQLKSEGFRNNVFITFTNDSNFWNDNGREKGSIYYKFREQKKLCDTIKKPTKSKNKIPRKPIVLKGRYDIKWKDVTMDENNNQIKCFIIKI